MFRIRCIGRGPSESQSVTVMRAACARYVDERWVHVLVEARRTVVDGGIVDALAKGSMPWQAPNNQMQRTVTNRVPLSCDRRAAADLER